MLGEKWARLLDLEHAQPLPTESISTTLIRREHDQIWKIKRLDNQDDLYVLLMLEFQTTIDPRMALRVSSYITLLYERLLAKGHTQLRDGLPSVLPIVLYTGLNNWNARKELGELLQPVPNLLLRYQPAQRYLLIEQHLWAKNKAMPPDNILAVVFF